MVPFALSWVRASNAFSGVVCGALAGLSRITIERMTGNLNFSHRIRLPSIAATLSMLLSMMTAPSVCYE